MRNFNVPHRTGLVDFPHPALQENSLHGRQRVQVVNDAGLRQRVVLPVLVEACPVERASLAAAVEPLQGQTQRHAREALERRHVAADPVVLVVPSQLRRQDRPPLLRRQEVPHALEPRVQLFALLAELLPARPPAHDELTPAAGAAEVGKPKEVEGVSTTILAFRVLSFVAAEADHTRLLRMQLQFKLREPFPQRLLHVPGVVLVLNHADEIVRITHHKTRPADLPFDSFLKPQVQHVVQEDI